MERLPQDATPEQAGDAIMTLLADWLGYKGEDGKRAVVFSVADADLDVENLCGWHGGYSEIVGPMMLELIRNANPLIRLLVAMALSGNDTPFPMTGQIDQIHRFTMDSFREKFATSDSFDGLDELVFETAGGEEVVDD